MYNNVTFFVSTFYCNSHWNTLCLTFSLTTLTKKFEIFIKYARVKSKYFQKIHFHLNFDRILRVQNLAAVGGAGSAAGEGSAGLRLSNAEIEIEIPQPFLVYSEQYCMCRMWCIILYLIWVSLASETFSFTSDALTSYF